MLNEKSANALLGCYNSLGAAVVADYGEKVGCQGQFLYQYNAFLHCNSQFPTGTGSWPVDWLGFNGTLTINRLY